MRNTEYSVLYLFRKTDYTHQNLYKHHQKKKKRNAWFTSWIDSFARGINSKGWKRIDSLACSLALTRASIHLFELVPMSRMLWRSEICWLVPGFSPSLSAGSTRALGASPPSSSLPSSSSSSSSSPVDNRETRQEGELGVYARAGREEISVPQRLSSFIPFLFIFYYFF